MSTTIPHGMRAPWLERVPSAPTREATGELMPSLETAVGTLTKSTPVRAAASFTVSITRPPPTARAVVTPFSMIVAAAAAASLRCPVRRGACRIRTP
jgi:hypothetical protein